ncbi:hypothetical protein J4Q44_G00252910 [Coregonus suidteri]|uniref:Uncharacterized protein n=1 Tax=Coregonus suidteri TaxID=861788 RepID=A0AAN8LE84_9TELE
MKHPFYKNSGSQLISTTSLKQDLLLRPYERSLIALAFVCRNAKEIVIFNQKVPPSVLQECIDGKSRPEKPHP